MTIRKSFKLKFTLKAGSTKITHNIANQKMIVKYDITMTSRNTLFFTSYHAKYL